MPLNLHQLAETLLSQHVPFSYENGWIELGSAKSGFRGHKGRKGKVGGSVARRSPLGVPVTGIVSWKLPEDLQEIADNAVFVKRKLRVGAAGHAPGQVGDTWVIPVNRDKPDPTTLIHEVVHAHQAELIRTDPNKHDDLIKEFEAAAKVEMKTVKNPLWAEDMPGDEIWPSAAGWYYGNAAFMVRESAPKVKAILDRVYGEPLPKTAKLGSPGERDGSTSSEVGLIS